MGRAAVFVAAYVRPHNRNRRCLVSSFFSSSSLITAGADRCVRVIEAHDNTSSSQVRLEGHTLYVNSVAYSDAFVASTGDDNTCRLWDIRAQTEACLFRLSSAGVSVSLNPASEHQVCVGERGGTIRLFDVRGVTQSPVCVFSCGTTQPLQSCDWSHVSPGRIGAVAGTEWFVWDLKSPSGALQRGQCHPEGAHAFTFSHIAAGQFATSGKSGLIRITTLAHPSLPLTRRPTSDNSSSAHERPSPLAWHASRRLLVTAAARSLHFFNADDDQFEL